MNNTSSTLALRTDVPATNPFLRRVHEATAALAAALAQARQVGDADGFRRAAHSIKSNSQTFGALALGALARDLELQGLHADSARDEQAIVDLGHAYALAAAALKEKAGV